jgi:cytoskeletal protein CcmA (bactofilin family)
MTHLTVNADGSWGTTTFNISLDSTLCDFTTTTETGSFTISGNFNGQVSGASHYVVMSTGVEVNTLTMDGMVSGGQIGLRGDGELHGVGNVHHESGFDARAVG